VATLVDRATRYAMVVALPDGNKPDAVARALIDHMSRLPAHLRRSLTWDRGSEMAQHSVARLPRRRPGSSGDVAEVLLGTLVSVG
jgi:IS30 family transposase